MKKTKVLVAKVIRIPKELFETTTELSVFLYGDSKLNFYIIEAIKEKNKRIKKEGM